MLGGLKIAAVFLICLPAVRAIAVSYDVVELPSFIKLTCDATTGIATINIQQDDNLDPDLAGYMAKEGIYELSWAEERKAFPLTCQLSPAIWVNVSRGDGHFSPIKLDVNGIAVATVSFTGNHALSLEEGYLVVKRPAESKHEQFWIHVSSTFPACTSYDMDIDGGISNKSFTCENAPPITYSPSP